VVEEEAADMTIGVTGRFSGAKPDLAWERKKFVVPEGTVFVLDRAMSILLLDHDPGEGYEVLIPARKGEAWTSGQE
jgi:hypothetical protein